MSPRFKICVYDKMCSSPSLVYNFNSFYVQFILDTGFNLFQGPRRSMAPEWSKQTSTRLRTLIKVEIPYREYEVKKSTRNWAARAWRKNKHYIYNVINESIDRIKFKFVKDTVIKNKCDDDISLERMSSNCTRNL